MTDEEYEAYKDFLNGKKVEKGNTNHNLITYLIATGFEETNCSSCRGIGELGGHQTITTFVYKKENIRVTVDMWE
jgi:hypothetical protein